MTSSFTWKQTGLAAACALALGMMSEAARAQTAVEETSHPGDGQGAVVMSGVAAAPGASAAADIARALPEASPHRPPSPSSQAPGRSSKRGIGLAFGPNRLSTRFP